MEKETCRRCSTNSRSPKRAWEFSPGCSAAPRWRGERSGFRNALTSHFAPSRRISSTAPSAAACAPRTRLPGRTTQRERDRWPCRSFLTLCSFLNFLFILSLHSVNFHSTSDKAVHSQTPPLSPPPLSTLGGEGAGGGGGTTASALFSSQTASH